MRRTVRTARGALIGLSGALALAVVALLVFQLVSRPGSPSAASSVAGSSGTGQLPAGTVRIDLRPGPADAVLTGRGDLTRLGLDNAEPVLTPAAVSSGRFGRRVA
jgi:hypothetical protein